MAITVDWGAGVINVPRADMTLVQVSPIEVRELNLDTFRLTLKALEDDEAGMPYPNTHNHQPPFTISGIQLARVVEITQDYTVTFEDGQYAVNLVGANTNLQDRVNINQVSVRPSNSAGLVQTAEIEYGSYNGGVSYDVINGEAGIAFPIGTVQNPVNNLADAKTIQSLKGLPEVLYVAGTLSLLSGDSLTGWDIIGESSWTSHCHNFSGGTLTDCEVRNCHVSGTFSGDTVIDQSRVFNVAGFAGEIRRSILDGGTITMSAGGVGHIMDCRSGVIGPGTSTIDCNGDGEIGIRGYEGGLTIVNKTSGNLSIDLDSGHIQFDATNTGGTAVLRGVGKLTDNSAGLTIDSLGLITRQLVAAEVWASQLEGTYTAEEVMRIMSSVLAGKVSGAGTGTETFRDINDTKDRVVSTVDVNGNRTAVTKDAT